MALTNLQVLQNQLNEVAKRKAKAILKRSDENWQRLTKYYTQDVTVISELDADGMGGYSEVQSKWIGVQNKGAKIPRRFARNAKYMRFTVGGRGTLVRNSLDSVPPVEGTQVVYAKTAKGFVLFPGNWDAANIKNIIENLDTL